MKKFIQSHPIEILFSILFVTVAVLLNLQFLEGANVNYSIAGHDEYLTVREVYSIVNPLSLKHFILAIVGGDILYYGRVMFYTDALFAFIPFKIWGLSGMVFAIRMIHSLWILISLLLLNQLFIKKRFNQFLFLFGSFGVMYTLYFIQMPKPEPLQLFFIVMFLRGLFKNNYLPNNYFIWLGLALAVKINVLVVLPVLLMIPIYLNRHHGLLKLTKVKLSMLFWFFIGFFIGIPCLLLTPIQPVYLQTYLHKTIFGTEKTYDDPNLVISQWLESGLGGHYLGSHFLAYIFIGLSIIILVYSFVRFFKTKENDFLKSFIILLLGLILTLSVMFLTKRLWPHYLWTGYILLWLGMIYFSEFKIQPILNRIFIGVLIVIFAVSSFAFYTKILPEFLKRENTSQNFELQIDSKHLYQYLESNDEYKEIGIDVTVFFPYRHFIHASPYHPFASERPRTASQIVKWHTDHPKEIWDKSDVVVFYKHHPSLENSIQKNGQDLYANEKELYELFLNKTQTAFQKDTTIGVYQVYKRIKP